MVQTLVTRKQSRCVKKRVRKTSSFFTQMTKNVKVRFFGVWRRDTWPCTTCLPKIGSSQRSNTASIGIEDSFPFQPHKALRLAYMGGQVSRTRTTRLLASF